MLANNETGVLQPMEAIGKIAADAGAFFHIDAVQGAGKVAFDVRRFGCHLLSISAHKMHGPKGVGAMFVRRGTPLEPLLVGGSHERRRAPAPRTCPASSAWARPRSWPCTRSRTARSTALQRCATGSKPACCGFPEPASTAAGTATERSAHGQHHQHRFDNVEGEAMVIALDLKGVAVSGGSACHSGSTEPSHVLMAMGLDKTARPRQPPLQPDEDRNRRRCGPCIEGRSRKRWNACAPFRR